jgi:hypothetical protein
MTQSKPEQPRGWLRTSMKAGGLLTFLVAFSALALGACESGGVGDPCLPEDEYKETFAGFKLSEENIESRSFQCKTRICLVNHFQGRVSCPQGQHAPTNCTDNQNICASGEECIEAGAIVIDCDPTRCGEGVDPLNCNNADNTNQTCGGRICNEDGRFCECQTGDCPEGFTCGQQRQCVTRVCSVGDPEKDTTHCYVPGTSIPVVAEVCAQCESASKRDAENAVYCSCRCGPPEENPDAADDNFNFCECPDNYVCEEIRPNVGLGDPLLAGKYCIKDATKYNVNVPCGTRKGPGGGTQCEGVAP